MEVLGKIGIDLWGMVLYLVNYGILLAVLGYFFYPKIIQTLEKRRETIKKNIEDTAHLQKVLEMQIEQHKKEKEELRANMQAESAKLKKEMQEKRSEMIKDMEAERQKLIEQTTAELDKKKEEIMNEAEAQTITLMKKVLLHVVSNKVPENVVQESVTDAWKQYRK